MSSSPLRLDCLRKSGSGLCGTYLLPGLTQPDMVVTFDGQESGLAPKSKVPKTL